MPRSNTKQLDLEAKAEQLINNAAHKSSLTIKTLLQDVQEHSGDCQSRIKVCYNKIF